MAEQWQVRRGESVHGPFTAAQLRELARRGKLRADDLVRKAEREEWTRAARLEGLFPGKPAAPADLEEDAAAEDVFAALAAASAAGAVVASPAAAPGPVSGRSMGAFIVPGHPCPQRIWLVACSVVCCLGTFLPWFFPEPNRTLQFSDVAGGWMPIPLSLMAILLALPGRWSQPLGGPWRLAAAAMLSIVAIFSGWRLGLYLSFVARAHLAAAADPRYAHVVTDAIKWTNTGPALPTMFIAAVAAVVALFILDTPARRARGR